MDPVLLKQIQMLVVTIIGAGVCVGGIVLLVRGVTSSGSIEVEGPGFKAKAVHAAPGLVVAVIGSALIYWSLTAGPTRSTRVTSTTPPATERLDAWLAHVGALTGKEPYATLLSVIPGNDSLRSESLVLAHEETLGDLARTAYGDAKYWPILAAINRDRGYYAPAGATAETRIAAGKLMEIWHPALHARVTSYEEFLKVRGSDLRDAYDQLLAVAQKAPPSEDTDRKLTQVFRQAELSYAVTYESVDGDMSLNDLALKWYREKKYVPIIRWRNQYRLPASLDATAPIARGTSVLIPHFIP